MPVQEEDTARNWQKWQLTEFPRGGITVASRFADAWARKP
jgi:hypothetical protein